VLATLGQLGYAVTDVNNDLPQDLLTSLRALPETVRLRAFPQRP
jgi:D-3-phosphoglycerate dehydrogenase